MGKSALAGAGLAVLFAAATPAAAQQSLSEATLNLRQACGGSLKQSDDIKYCQQAFISAAQNLAVVQKNMLSAPHYVRYGLAADSDTVMVNKPERGAHQVAGVINRYCANLASKDQSNPQSERLDDGSRMGLLRIAERAIACATMTEYAGKVAEVPSATSLIMNLKLNAEDVKWQVNRVAFNN